MAGGIAGDPARESRPEQQQPLLEGEGHPVAGPAEDPGLPLFLLFSCFSACLGAFSFGYIVGYTSPALDPMTAELGLSARVAALFSSLVPLGAMLGAAGAGPLSEKHGRRTALGLAAHLVALHWLLIAFTSLTPMLLFARFLGGIGIGIASLTVPVYVAEVAPEELRGSLGSCNQLFITLGIVSVYGLGLILAPSAPAAAPAPTAGPAQPAGAFSSWRLLALAGLLPGLALILAVFFIPESPRWLAQHSPVAAVRATLRRLRSTRTRSRPRPRGTEASPVEADFEQAPASSNPVPAAGAGAGARNEGAGAVKAAQEHRVEEEVQSIMAAVEKERERQQASLASGGHSASALALLLQPRNLKPLLVGVGLMVVQQLSGINAVIFFAASIFASAGFTNPNVPSCTVAVIQVIITLVSTLLTDRLGRRPLLLTSSSVMALSAFGLGLAFFLQQQHQGDPATPEAALGLLLAGGLQLPAALSGLCCILFVVGFAIGIGPLPWVLMAEILPPPVKGSAGSIVVLSNWFLCFAITQTFPFLLKWSPAGTFWLYSGVCCLGTLFVFGVVPETKNKSLEEIARFFS